MLQRTTIYLESSSVVIQRSASVQNQPRPSTNRTITRGGVNATSDAPSKGVATSVVSAAADSEIAFLNCHHRSSSPLPCGRREPIFITSRTGPGRSYLGERN